MIRRDGVDLALTGADGASAEHYRTAIHQFQCYIDDPVATVDRALAASPGFVMAHVFRAYLHLLGTEPAGIAVARECVATARTLPADARERAHIVAAEHLAAGRWYAAGRALEDIAIDEPRDALALQVGHQIDFFTGDARMLRDRIARARPAWSEGLPGYHAVLGMYAFGLEETADYPAAELYGREAAELEPRDAWAWHAVAHVMEMQGRQRDGIAWMRANSDAWSRDSFFAVHNWWHLALFHLDLGEIGTVLALYDGPIFGARSTVLLDMIDASAMLWRLHLRGVDLGDRWSAVADNWEAFADAGNYAFNDVHAVMAFVGAGRGNSIDQVLAAQEKALAGPGDNATFVREVGRPVTAAIVAFGRGDYDETLRLLRPVRNRAGRFGGSHAQRDILDLTMIEAALRAGRMPLARALARERIAVKPTSPSARMLLDRAEQGSAAA